MAAPNPYQQYRQNQINTSTPGELTLMLYQGAVRFVKQAKQSMEHGDIQRTHQHIVRVQDIIQELIVTLNMDYEISQQLSSLYDYLNRRLIEANVKKDLDILNEVQGFLEEFQQVWNQAVKLAKAQSGAVVADRV